MIDRLNARACFDALYQQAAMRLRDSAALRQQMQQGWRLSLGPAARQRIVEHERQIELEEDAQRECIPWQQVLRQWPTSVSDGPVREVDWSHVPTINTGSRFSGARLLGEVMQRHPQRLQHAQGHSLQVVALHQRDRYRDLLIGGVRHPGIEVSETLKAICQEHDWQGPVVFVPTSLFAGLITLQQAPGLKVNAECAALPPLESVLQLRGPATGDEDWRQMLVLWFGTEYGIPQPVLDHLLQLDWQSHSWACRY
jgi:hypothetical protein